METKYLKLEGTPGTQESQYVMSILVPGKFDLLNMIEKPPYHICSKDDTTYSTGILAHVPHSFKLRISRDYQDPVIGLYGKIMAKPDEIIEIREVKGAFIFNPSSTQASNTNPQAISQIARSRICPPNSNTAPQLQNCNITINRNMNDGKSEIAFSFFKSSVSKLYELESYDYYESRCNWPDVTSRVELTVKVVKTNYSVLVDDESCACESLPKNTVSSTPYFLSDVYSDVTIQVGEELFPAHKIILSERSLYFARMFANTMRESQEGFVKIPEEDESLFRELLRFIYQGSVQNLEENASELYILADKYDIPELTSLCEKHLLSQLTVENAMELYDLSQSIGSQKNVLGRKSKELIMWNREKFASDLETFTDFSRKYPELIFELLQI